MTVFRSSAPKKVGRRALSEGFKRLRGCPITIAVVAVSIPLILLAGCRPERDEEQGVAAEEDSSQIGLAHIHPGSGNFLLEGGAGHPEKKITVFYHQPETFLPNSPILVVVPGAGRNAGDYRDAWIEASETFGVLILSPMYPEKDFDFGAYHMGGLLSEMNIAESSGRGEGPNEVTLDEELFTYKVNRNSEQWIFQDFDRLFERVATDVGSTRERYDRVLAIGSMSKAYGMPGLRIGWIVTTEDLAEEI